MASLAHTKPIGTLLFVSNDHVCSLATSRLVTSDLQFHFRFYIPPTNKIGVPINGLMMEHFIFKIHA